MSSTLPLRLVIGFSPGSASENLANLLAPELSASLGRPITIEPLIGERGLHAMRATMASPPDGTTLLIATLGTHVIDPARKREPLYNPLNEFTPVSLAVKIPLILGVRNSLDVRDLGDLIRVAVDRELVFGSSGIGSAPHLAGEMFQRFADVRMMHRAYPDTRDLYDDLLNGRLDLSFNNSAGMVPHVDAGRLKAIGVTTTSRCAALPDVPTLAEDGLSGFELDNWLGFVAPPGTPDQIVRTQAKAVQTALRVSGIVKKLKSTGIEPIGSDPEGFSNFLIEELSQARRLTRQDIGERTFLP